MNIEIRKSGRSKKIWASNELLIQLLNKQPVRAFSVEILRISCFEQTLSQFFGSHQQVLSDEEKKIRFGWLLSAQIFDVKTICNSTYFSRDFSSENFLSFVLFSTFLTLIRNPNEKYLNFLPDYTGNKIEYLKKFRNLFFIEDIPLYYFERIQNIPEINEILLTFPSYQDRNSLYSFSSPVYLRFLSNHLLNNSVVRFNTARIVTKIEERIRQLNFPLYGEN